MHGEQKYNHAKERNIYNWKRKKFCDMRKFSEEREKTIKNMKHSIQGEINI